MNDTLYLLLALPHALALGLAALATLPVSQHLSNNEQQRQSNDGETETVDSTHKGRPTFRMLRTAMTTNSSSSAIVMKISSAAQHTRREQTRSGS